MVPTKPTNSYLFFCFCIHFYLSDLYISLLACILYSPNFRFRKIVAPNCTFAQTAAIWHILKSLETLGLDASTKSKTKTVSVQTFCIIFSWSGYTADER